MLSFAVKLVYVRLDSLKLFDCQNLILIFLQDSKKSALHHACSKELFTIVDMLLAAGANIHLKDKV